MNTYFYSDQLSYPFKFIGIIPVEFTHGLELPYTGKYYFQFAIAHQSRYSVLLLLKFLLNSYPFTLDPSIACIQINIHFILFYF